MQQLRYAIRAFARRPAFAIALIASVALGIGGNSVVLGFMKGLVTRPMPLPEAPGVAVTVLAQRGDGLGLLSPQDVALVVQQTDLFDTVIALLETRNPVRLEGRSSIASVAWASPSAVAFFGFPRGEGVVLGNVFAARELQGTRARDARITIDDESHGVAGVAPPSLEGAYIGRPIDVWVLSDPTSPPRVATPMLSLIGRLRDGISIRDAQGGLSRVSEAGTPLVVAEYSGLAPDMQGAMNRLSRLMPAVSGAVFLIACANVAVLLLSRASRQSRDSALRMAIGATRMTLARATLIDASLIAVAGAAAGVLVAVWTADAIPALLFAPDAERMTFVADRNGILLSAAVSAFVVICCGAAPIVANRRDTPARVLSREPDRPSRALDAVRKSLVVAQMAVCCVLVISAVTVSAALDATLRTAAGERLESALVATAESRYGYSRPDLGLQYFASIEDTILEEPGVSGVAWTTTLPGSRPGFHAMSVEPPSLPTRTVEATASVFTADALPAVELPPLSGRMFGGEDTRESCTVAILTTAAATRLFATAPPAGRLVTDSGGRVAEIVGVVSPAKGVRAGPARTPDLYYYDAQEPVAFDRTQLSLQVPLLPAPVTAMLDVRIVSPGYFGVMGLERVAGQLLDAPPGHACRIGVLNQQAADLYFGGPAVGGAVIDGRGRRITIVGVVRDARLRSTHRRPEPALYVPLEQEFAPKLQLLIASADASPERQANVRRRIGSIDGGVPAALAVATLEERLSRIALASERIAALLLSVASLNALALAVIGLYRITADDVLERQRELAVRSALGAQAWRLILLVVGRLGRTVMFGVIAGMCGALLVLRWIGGVTGFDNASISWIWVAGPLAVATGSLLASLLPARRILKLDPLTAMRSE